jgi:hypothetical protein
LYWCIDTVTGSSPVRNHHQRLKTAACTSTITLYSCLLVVRTPGERELWGGDISFDTDKQVLIVSAYPFRLPDKNIASKYKVFGIEKEWHRKMELHNGSCDLDKPPLELVRVFCKGRVSG